MGSRSLTMGTASDSRLMPMGPRSVTRARKQRARLTLGDNGQKASILRLLGGKQASARLWPTTSGSVHLARQGFPTVHSSREVKLPGETLQGVEALGQVHEPG